MRKHVRSTGSRMSAALGGPKTNVSKEWVQHSNLNKFFAPTGATPLPPQAPAPQSPAALPPSPAPATASDTPGPSRAGMPPPAPPAQSPAAQSPTVGGQPSTAADTAVDTSSSEDEAPLTSRRRVAAAESSSGDAQKIKDMRQLLGAAAAHAL